MFRVEWKPRIEGISGRFGTVYMNDTRICNVQTWGLGSCAIAMLQNWGWMCKVPKDKLDDFFTWMCDAVDEDWNPAEFYFMLSDEQVRKHYFNFLTKHPNVKRRDVFRNKSHGPNKVILYRYSAEDDFGRVVNRKATQ